MLSRNITDKLRGYETPFYLYDMQLLNNTCDTAAECASRYGYHIHYALKANSDAKIVACMKEHGFGTDCVSGNEVRFSIEQGFDPRSIVFAGVGKTDSEIIYALKHDIMAFNCESRQELEVINHLASKCGRKARVALRINPDIDPMTHRHISTGHANSKFGISYKEINEICDQAAQLNNIDIVGLHFHIGSQITDLRIFEYLCLRINSIYGWFAQKGLTFRSVNVGGGLGVNYINPETEPMPDFDRYFRCFNENLALGCDTEVHFELGRSLVAQCGELISRVLFTKTTAGGKNIAIIDASMTELLRPALYDAAHAIENLSSVQGGKEYIIAGTVCESSDIFADNIKLPETNRGDILSIKTTGAYGVSMASQYNMHDLPRSVYSDNLQLA